MEIFSKSTAGYDRRGEVPVYLRLPSLNECLLVDLDEPSAQFFRRVGEDTWRMVVFKEDPRLC